jgi:hypothetical protein
VFYVQVRSTTINRCTVICVTVLVFWLLVHKKFHRAFTRAIVCPYPAYVDLSSSQAGHWWDCCSRYQLPSRTGDPGRSPCVLSGACACGACARRRAVTAALLPIPAPAWNVQVKEINFRNVARIIVFEKRTENNISILFQAWSLVVRLLSHLLKNCHRLLLSSVFSTCNL